MLHWHAKPNEKATRMIFVIVPLIFSPEAEKSAVRVCFFKEKIKFYGNLYVMFGNVCNVWLHLIEKF